MPATLETGPTPNDTDSFDITVAAVNDAPNLTVPAAQTLLGWVTGFDAASGNLFLVDDATETGSVVGADGGFWHLASRTDGLLFRERRGGHVH